MPDVGSSQNVQTAQDTPQLNGSAGQNGEKYPDNEVRYFEFLTYLQDR